MKAKRIDGNQNEIVRDLRKMGCSVFITSMVGRGYPDLSVGFRNFNYLFELKDGNKYKSQQKLTELEQFFHLTWRGQANIITCLNDVIDIFNKNKII